MKMFIKLKNKIRSFLALDKLQTKLIYEINRDFLIREMLNSVEKGVTNTSYCEHDVIVSLTTFGKRIHEVAITIESIMQGSLKPNKLVLWLGEDMQDKKLPEALLRQQKRGLDIYYCRDLRSYTKLIPSLRKFKDSVIVTIDDDVIYKYDFLELLIESYKSNPDYIWAYRVHRITFDKDGRPDPYMKWKWGLENLQPSALNFLTGVGGVLYPPSSLAEDVLDEKTFLEICKYADDIWFWAMAFKKGSKVAIVPARYIGGINYYYNPEEPIERTLRSINTTGIKSMNDIQLDNVLKKFNLYKSLKEIQFNE